ncbi:hypothetical protein GDO78_010358 [Eleutherodactylus coqui]|uniref:Uncharacterized protein n=1 Tax=Eleutherodactylus coqui TaxID=57060 RepID=A0A8J6K4Y8_ELECQ|nr:hypothetical protein GDO78_010358 [Eleutherodactylus coqui]
MREAGSESEKKGVGERRRWGGTERRKTFERKEGKVKHSEKRGRVKERREERENRERTIGLMNRRKKVRKEREQEERKSMIMWKKGIVVIVHTAGDKNIK